MPLLPPRPLPRRFNRRVGPGTRILLRTQRLKTPGTSVRFWNIFLRWRRRVPTLSEIFRPLLILIALIILGGSLTLSLFSPLLTVREVRVLRMNPRLDIEEVQQALHPLFGRHLLTVSSLEVMRLLRARLLDVLEVDVSKRYPDALIVRIQLEPIVARLVILGPDDFFLGAAGTGEMIGNDFLTSGGRYVSSPSGELELTSSLLLSLADWGARPLPGEVLFEPSFLRAMEQAETALAQQFGKEVQQRLVYLRAREFHLRIPEGVLWFDAQGSIPEALQRYRTFLKAVPPSEVQEYVDLRLSDRVTYR